MNLILKLIDLFLHLDTHLESIIQQFQAGTYLILFLVIFIETGVVIFPFLPGDSLIFAAGAFSARTDSPLNIVALFILLCIAAIAGDTANYWIGHSIGPRAFSGNTRFLKKEYLDRTHDFYERHGGKTIILARFIPIIRTFAPFVAGIGSMTYPHFISYNVIGGIAWVALFSFGGYFFGELPFVKNNFSFVVLAIIFISVMPGVIEFLRERKRNKLIAKPAENLKPEG
jgi:membrane-associated protein